MENCENVTQLWLIGSKLSCEQLGNAITHMGNLEKLEVQVTGDFNCKALLSSRKLMEFTVHMPRRCQVQKWISYGFTPCNLNIFTEKLEID